MPFLTPDALPTTFLCRRLRIPDDAQWLEIVNGVLSELNKAHNFELFGLVTPDECAEVFMTMFMEYLEGEVELIGSVQLFATENAPDGALLCDGSTYLRTDYPRLYDALDARYIVDADHFKTPAPVGHDGLNYYLLSR